MKLIIKKLSIALIGVMLFTGCTKQSNEKSIVYSNLIDSSSQKEVIGNLEMHGISKEQTDTFVSWIKDYNSRIKSSKLSKGFHPMEKDGVDYSQVVIENKNSKDDSISYEANCRLTSYLLMKNMIQTNGKKIDNDTVLMFDIQAIDTVKQFNLSETERNNFISLFSWIPVDNAKTLKEHENIIKNAWKDREIKISGQGISLISVYLHSPFDHVRFIGHTGILLETNDKLLFVEKYGPLFPFQATKFSSREELKNYLLNRKDFYGDETELKPIIMENNDIL